MRDLETISVALTAAETGHLVFATLHTQDAAQTIDRVSADVIRAKAVEQGMRLLKDDGLEKVRLGVTSIQEISRVT